MGILKKAMGIKDESDEEILDKSIYISNEKVDKAGNSWRKKSFWFRAEHLGKLKVISHFEGKTAEKLIDLALASYIRDKLDNSQAVKKLVAKKAPKIIKGQN